MVVEKRDCVEKKFKIATYAAAPIKVKLDIEMKYRLANRCAIIPGSNL